MIKVPRAAYSSIFKLVPEPSSIGFRATSAACIRVFFCAEPTTPNNFILLGTTSNIGWLQTLPSINISIWGHSSARVFSHATASIFGPCQLPINIAVKRVRTRRFLRPTFCLEGKKGLACKSTPLGTTKNLPESTW